MLSAVPYTERVSNRAKGEHMMTKTKEKLSDTVSTRTRYPRRGNQTLRLVMMMMMIMEMMMRGVVQMADPLLKEGRRMRSWMTGMFGIIQEVHSTSRKIPCLLALVYTFLVLFFEIIHCTPGRKI